MKPLLILDLFCGAGGASMGYYQAFADPASVEITGVDNRPQKRYPFSFIQADALDYVEKHGREYDFIASSPPCQFASQITPDKSKHHNFIPATRDALQATGKPYVIENVTGARNHLLYPIMLCGAMFPDLRVYRHRYFETSLTIDAPGHSPHDDNTPRAGHGVSDKGFVSITSGGHKIEVPYHKDGKRRSGVYSISSKGFVSVTGHFSGIDYCRYAMGIDWMVASELSQAIPPKMTQYIGAQLFRQMGYETIMPEMNSPVQLSLFSALEAVA